MPGSERPIIETRHEQMFPVLERAEIDRLRRFGEPRSYGAGERLSTTGEIGPGMLVILAGKVVITQRDELAAHEPIVTYGPGSFLGELAQLSSLKRSALRSRRRKASPYQSAASMLTFYINRAGKGLKPAQRRVLERAKSELRKAFGHEAGSQRPRR